MPRQDERGLSAKLLRQLSASLGALRGHLHVAAQVTRSLSEALQRDVPSAEAADALSQAIVCGSAVATPFAGDWHKCRDWLLEAAAPWERFVLERIEAAAVPAVPGTFSDLTHLYEQLLRREQPQRRKFAGVFFTPAPIVRYMLREIDRYLRDEFDLPLGLADAATWGEVRQRAPSLKLPAGAADADPFVKLFDPAVGTGVFLLEVIDVIEGALEERWRNEGLAADEMAARWNDYVPRQLLPRLWGMELLPAPCILARLHVALKLAQSGYGFQSPARIEIHLGNTLAGPMPPLLPPARQEPAYDVPFTVVLGNPPFSYLSENQSDWIASLVRGDGPHAGYLQAGGQKLGEKKTWLHDDYVKFLRYAQWRIESTGCGIAAFVTNHGYLTNATFRLMRQQLLHAFPRISVVDLHGNRKAREVSPDGSRDENVFGLDQGIAIGFFRRPVADMTASVRHAELWGTRAAKFERLDTGHVFNPPNGNTGQAENQAEKLRDRKMELPAAADYSFAPAAGVLHPEYAAAPSLTDLLPLHATAPVTARDHFVVALTRGELRARVDAFRNLSIPDDEIRLRYFTRTRSPRYERGDTRGWKLAAARRALAAIDDWESFLQPCQYRPLDWRWIVWHPSLIDWPRHEVTSHFVRPMSKVQGPKSPLESDFGPWTLDFGLALIARRQLPPTEPAAYFWATSALALDGIIRNDNRGSESLFPIEEESFSQACYAYALFHSPTYRQRYAATLRTGFPRVLPARDGELAAALTAIGGQLIKLHVQRPPQFHVLFPAESSASQRILVSVAPGFPRYGDGRVWIRDDYAIAATEEATWQFRVGAHQIARKWLVNRRGRPLTEADIAWYRIILAAIRETCQLAQRIETTIEHHGGFPSAFLTGR